jgi:hypothetical protein
VQREPAIQPLPIADLALKIFMLAKWSSDSPQYRHHRLPTPTMIDPTTANVTHFRSI